MNYTGSLVVVFLLLLVLGVFQHFMLRLNPRIRKIVCYTLLALMFGSLIGASVYSYCSRERQKAREAVSEQRMEDKRVNDSIMRAGMRQVLLQSMEETAEE